MKTTGTRHLPKVKIDFGPKAANICDQLYQRADPMRLTVMRYLLNCIHSLHEAGILSNRGQTAAHRQIVRMAQREVATYTSQKRQRARELHMQKKLK